MKKRVNRQISRTFNPARISFWQKLE